MSVLEGEQPWPNPRPGAVRMAQKLLLGPTGPNATLVDWHRMRGVPVLLAGGWPEAEGDPKANPLWPRSWRKGAAFAVDAAFVSETLQQEPSARPGVAYLSGGHITAGMLPEGRNFGTLHDEKLIIGRTGRYAQVMAPVMIVPETSSLITPPSARLVQDRIAIGNAATLYILGNPPVV